MATIDWTGLDLVSTIKQSILVHPDWDEAAHRSYLLSETVFEDAHLSLNAEGKPWAADSGDEQCTYPPGCDHQIIDGGKLCFHHFVNVGRLFAPAPGHSW